MALKVFFAKATMLLAVSACCLPAQGDVLIQANASASWSGSILPPCSDSVSQTGALPVSIDTGCSYQSFSTQASASGIATPGIFSGFSLQAFGASGFVPGFSVADATVTAAETVTFDIAGGFGTGNLLLDFVLAGTGYEDYSSGVASMNFSVLLNQSQLIDTSCPYAGGDFAGYACGPAYFSVSVPFTFGQPFTVTQLLTGQAETSDGGTADALLSSSLAGYAIQQNGFLISSATLSDEPSSGAPEPASISLGFFALLGLVALWWYPRLQSRFAEAQRERG